MDSGWPKKAFVRWSVHWCHLANTIEPSMCGCGLSVELLWPLVLRARALLQPITTPESVSVWQKFPINYRNLKLHLLQSAAGDKMSPCPLSRGGGKQMDPLSGVPEWVPGSIYATVVCHRAVSSKLADDFYQTDSVLGPVAAEPIRHLATGVPLHKVVGYASPLNWRTISCVVIKVSAFSWIKE